MTRLIWIVSSIALICAQSITSKSVTYPGIGTFNSHDFFDPKHRPFTDLFLPQSPEHIDPQFLLYTRHNRDNADHLQWNSTESVRTSHFDASKQTKIVIHGFIDNQLVGEWMRLLKSRLLDYEDVNVIVVDWHKGNFFPYGQAVVNTRVMGPMVAIQIQTICQVTHTTPASFHIIAHSLGAHIAGYAGKVLGPRTIGRITGMDPAGPFFEGLPNEARLRPTDAAYVDNIHTDARPMLEVGLGMYETCGHTDIYPNGGRVQPGCDQERVTAAIFHGVFEGGRRLAGCNHQRAVDFYIDSLDRNAPLPKAYKCDNFEDFTAGKCIDCGSNGEKCAILGPRNIEYKNSVADINHGVEGVNGKRFFMITGQHEPLLNKYQYIVHIHMTSHGLEQFDKLAHVHIKFVNRTDHSEAFNFNDQAKLSAVFKIGQSYTHPGVMAMDPESLESIDFEWDHGAVELDILHLEKMHVDRIEVIGLTSSTSTSRSAPLVKQYCNGNNSIPSQKHIQFIQC